jgi:fumarate hydratase, class II
MDLSNSLKAEIVVLESLRYWDRAQQERIREHLDNCLMLVMALNPHIGYEKAAKISLTAYHEDLTLRDAVLKLGFLIGGQFDSWVRPDEMTHLLRGAR